MQQPFFFDPEQLQQVAKENHDSFLDAQPYPHVVIDGLLPDGVLEQVVLEAPDPEADLNWIKRTDENSLKRGLREDWTMGVTTRQVLNQFNSASFVNFLETLTDIKGLIPDPHFHGGGLHTIEPGGFLRVHADFNHYARLNLDRRINALLYLNADWQDDWGGHLELWDKSLTTRVKAVAPLFNRLVVFATTDIAYHGHPKPLECPPDRKRRSLALYYYSNGRPEQERSAVHGTLWKPGIGEDWRADRTAPTSGSATAARPSTSGSATAARPSTSRSATKESAWREFVPPVAFKWARKLSEAGRNAGRSAGS